jgi:hypothetical protein
MRQYQSGALPKFDRLVRKSDVAGGNGVVVELMAHVDAVEDMAKRVELVKAIFLHHPPPDTAISLIQLSEALMPINNVGQPRHRIFVTSTGLQSRGVDQRKVGSNPGILTIIKASPSSAVYLRYEVSVQFRRRGAARRSVSVATADGLAKHAGFGLCASHK